ncbi:TIGR03862 family flavoprotein [Cognatiyoonia sp. IB215446]|uniref:TIGR03862 family flavoprotein n=1 Tax=Cognatiyoonia sp. IB215446 TaxID=3097355 RepID=UPI002A0DAE4F|nr:TIGR03862 family flavoprotein [Cognatiyoonia sp. IB215446]MDX8350381.1 TIGR03862 family flavoprotein [Cognatiyoonia sp. IB215446]
MADAVVIGAGPAGLMAADVLASGGLQVILADAMPSIGRKFLMAGKSGLNLTKVEPEAEFLAAVGPLPPAMQKALSEFGPDEVIAWAKGLGQQVFTGSTGRIFPNVMKASPLLRAWLARLADLGVSIRTRWRWDGWDGADLVFETSEGRAFLQPRVTVLALGGASWARLGANGLWAQQFEGSVAPFAPANMGFRVAWSDHMTRHFGAPIKSIALKAGDQVSRGECVISERGIEGGGVYAVSRAVREGAALTVDLLPDWLEQRVADALAKPRGKASLSNHLRKVLRLDPVRLALLAEFGRPYPNDLAPLIKALPIRHLGPRPMDEAISTAGGIMFDKLTDGLMLRDRPGVFCAGEMLDWEAPTGGYLITGCLATGRLAARAALHFATDIRPRD